MDSASAVAWAVGFVIVTVAVSGVSGRARLSAPVALVGVGAVVSFIPGIPAVRVDPDLLLYGLLPPLLYAAAIRSPLRDVRVWKDALSILLLSVVLVIVTALVVGFSLVAVIPAVTLAAAIALGAVIAPTDAVAVTAVSAKIRLPRRIDANLQGESLLNDATALVVLNASIAAIIGVVQPTEVAVDFVLAVVVGIAVGLLVGVSMAWVRAQSKDPVLDTSLSLIIPYVAFILAQFAHGSGVLAVVVCGIYLSRRSPRIQSAEARIAERFNWRTIQFLLENAIFLFIGLTLADVFAGVSESGVSLPSILLLSVGMLVLIALVRFSWVLLVTGLYRIGPKFLRQRSWPWRNGVVVAAAGTRGVVTLAAVFLLPEATPYRELLQFLAFVVVVGTLLESLLLPSLLRALRLPPPDDTEERDDERALLTAANEAGASWIAEQSPTAATESPFDRLLADSTFVGDSLKRTSSDGETSISRYSRLRRQMIKVQRTAVLTEVRAGDFSDAAVRRVLSALDAEETALKTGYPDTHPDQNQPQEKDATHDH